MVLESLITPWNAERSPWELFFIGIVYASVGILLSTYIFSEHIGIVMVFLTTLASVYLVQKIFTMEEESDTPVTSEISILKHHAKALSVFMFLFLGFTVAFSFWYIVLPAETTHSIFQIQEDTIRCINTGNVEGCATGLQGAFFRILANNIKVMVFTLVFALFFGAGAVFILAWNAAVVGTAIGIFFRNSIGTAANSLGLTSVASYFGVYSASLLRYLTHGWLEILAYFMAALAGGMISAAVAKHEFGSAQFKKVLVDSVDVMALAVGTIFLAAVVEVFITPLLF